jgi:glutathione peroxidase
MKSDVNGKHANDVFKFLRLNSRLRGKKICWNFGKFLVDRQGNVVEYYGFSRFPLEMTRNIESSL